MSLFLPKLTCKKDIDEVIKCVAEKVLVLRFGRDDDSVCLQLDEIVRRTVNAQSCSMYAVTVFFFCSIVVSVRPSSCQKRPMT